MSIPQIGYLRKYTPDTRIWRYMGITKFLSMMFTRSLFFTRSDKFEDKFEGALHKDVVKWLNTRTSTLEETKKELTKNFKIDRKSAPSIVGMPMKAKAKQCGAFI